MTPVWMGRPSQEPFESTRMPVGYHHPPRQDPSMPLGNSHHQISQVQHPFASRAPPSAHPYHPSTRGPTPGYPGPHVHGVMPRPRPHGMVPLQHRVRVPAPAPTAPHPGMMLERNAPFSDGHPPHMSMRRPSHPFPPAGRTIPPSVSGGPHPNVGHPSLRTGPPNSLRGAPAGSVRMMGNPRFVGAPMPDSFVPHVEHHVERPLMLPPFSKKKNKSLPDGPTKPAEEDGPLNLPPRSDRAHAHPASEPLMDTTPLKLPPVKGVRRKGKTSPPRRPVQVEASSDVNGAGGIVAISSLPTDMRPRKALRPSPLKKFIADTLPEAPIVSAVTHEHKESKVSAKWTPKSLDKSGLQDAASLLLGLAASSSPPPPGEREPKSFPTRLSTPLDKQKLNSMHCFLREELLELFVVEAKFSCDDSSTSSRGGHSPALTSEGSGTESDRSHVIKHGTASGRVGLRCVHCAQARRGRGGLLEYEAPMAVFYPKTVNELYRLVTSWQRVHLRKCRNLPKSVRESFNALKEGDKRRGKTQFWITSARNIGLVDSVAKSGGIRFDPYADDVPLE